MKDEIGEKALMIVEQAQLIRAISDKEDYSRANECRNMLLQAMADVRADYDDLAANAYKSWKSILARRSHYYDPCEAAAKILKVLMAEYVTKEEQERINEQNRLRTEEIKRAEDARLEEAQACPEIADEILARPLAVAPVVIPKENLGGPVFKTIWDAEVYDLDLLIKAVSNGAAPRECLMPDTKFLRRQAVAFQDRLNLAGVRSFSRRV